MPRRLATFSLTIIPGGPVGAGGRGGWSLPKFPLACTIGAWGILFAGFHHDQGLG
jgi:hypothetical protein